MGHSMLSKTTSMKTDPVMGRSMSISHHPHKTPILSVLQEIIITSISFSNTDFFNDAQLMFFLK